MEFIELEQLISDTASQKNMEKADLINDLSDILKMKYGISIMEKERELIDEVKMKVITKLYNAEDQSIHSKKDPATTFKLDLLEIDYLDISLDELQQEGLIKTDKEKTKITKEGVMKFKSFYGEI